MNKYTFLTPEQGFRVAAWMRTIFGLKGNELLIFAIVYNYTGRGMVQGVGGSRFFAEWTGASADTITRSVQNLERAGLIELSGHMNGQKKKYVISDAVWQKLAEFGLADHPQNKDGSEQTTRKMSTNHPQNKDGSGEPPAKLGGYEVDHPQNADRPPAKLGQTTRKIRVATENDIKRYDNDIEKEKREKEKENITATPDIVERSMLPAAGHEVPTMQEVITALRNMTVRPVDSQLETCAGYFLDKMDREQWRTRDWRSALCRYAARWVTRDRNQQTSRMQSRQIPYCKPGDTYKDPGECPW